MYCKQNKKDFVVRHHELTWCAEILPFYVDLNSNFEFILKDQDGVDLGLIENHIITEEQEHTKLGIAINYYIEVLVCNHVINWSKNIAPIINIE